MTRAHYFSLVFPSFVTCVGETREQMLGIEKQFKPLTISLCTLFLWVSPKPKTFTSLSRRVGKCKVARSLFCCVRGERKKDSRTLCIFSLVAWEK